MCKRAGKVGRIEWMEESFFVFLSAVNIGRRSPWPVRARLARTVCFLLPLGYYDGCHKLQIVSICSRKNVTLYQREILYKALCKKGLLTASEASSLGVARKSLDSSASEGKS